jgi:hypothetical protein
LPKCKDREVVVWGNQANIPGSSDLFEWNFRMRFMLIFEFSRHDLLVDKGEKQVSSTVGHDLMHNHPLPKGDLLKRMKNLDALITIFESGDKRVYQNCRKRSLVTRHDDDFDAVFILMNQTHYKSLMLFGNLDKRKFRLFHARCWF